ncbi:hypothetical protein QTP86_030620, partial [Hemibagrus guttatus]
QDNAPCHKAKMVQEQVDEYNELKVLTWPPKFPDLNPIEHLWDVLNEQVRSMETPPCNLQDLKDLQLTSWCQIQQYTFRDLVESMPRQNTLQPMNPAEVSNLHAVFAYQSDVLREYQDQLTKAQAANEYLTQHLRSLPPPVPRKVSFALPDKFDGSVEQCKGFLRQVEIFFKHQGTDFESEEKKCAFLMSLLTGKAIEWAAAVWETDHLFQTSYTYFVKQLRDVFEYPAGGKDVSTRLLQLSQGLRLAAEYAIEFRTLAAQSGWNDVALKAVFQRSLNIELQAELACKGVDHSFSEYVTLAIQIDNLMCSTHARIKSASMRNIPTQPLTPSSNSTPSVDPANPEPMQLGATRLSPAERSRWLIHNLCFYYEGTGHRNSGCPLKTRGSINDNNRVSVDHLLRVNESLTTDHDSFDFTAPIDSGSALNLIHQDLIKTFNIPIQPCNSPLKVNAVNNKPIGDGIRHQTLPMQLQVGLFHRETITFYVIDSPRHEIILGYPWLSVHNPVISWYQDLQEVFSKAKATQLPPHRPWDCAIDLLPNAMPPKSKVYPLSRPETQAMEDYIEEALSSGFIRPSTSPAAAGFFFVEKKDGGLRPCIDYRGPSSYHLTPRNTLSHILLKIQLSPVGSIFLHDFNSLLLIALGPRTAKQMPYPGVTKHRANWITLKSSSHPPSSWAPFDGTKRRRFDKPSHQLPEGLMEPLPIPQCPWSHISTNFLTDLPDPNGFNTVMVIIDQFSEACKLIPLKGLPTAMEVANALFQHIFRNCGLPEDIVSDCGPQLLSTYRISPTFHVSLLKLAHEPHSARPVDSEPPPPLDIDGAPAYQ